MRRALLVTFFLFAGALTATAQTTFYFPQIADGVQGGGISWKTTIFLTNPAAAGSGAVSGSVVFTNANGLPLQISFVNESNQPVSSGNTVPFQIAGLQTRKFVSTAAGLLDNGVGFATVTANGVVSGTAVFSLYGPGGLISEAGVPAVLTATRQAVVVDTTQGFNTGVAFANPGISAPPTTLKLINVEGAEVMSTATSGTPTFHTAKFVDTMFLPLVPPPMVGTLQISSSVPLAVVGLRFAPTGGVFTTVPTVTLASIIQPALQWLQQKPWLSPFSSLARLLAGVQFRLG